MRANLLTADLYDDFGKQCNSCEIQFRQFGKRRVFAGRIRTIKP